MASLYRFGLTILSVIITAFIVWFSLRQYGLSRPPSPYQTEMIQAMAKMPTPIQFQTWAPDKPASGHLAISIEYKNEVWMIRDSDWSLENFLNHHQSGFLLIDLDLDATSQAAKLKEITKATRADDKILFSSRSDGTLKDLRELNPKWSFTNGEVFLARFLSLSSLGLAPVMEISSDVFMIHTYHLNPSPEWQSLFEEAKRQNKPILIGPVTRPLEGYHPETWWVQPSSRDI